MRKLIVGGILLFNAESRHGFLPPSTGESRSSGVQGQANK